MLLKLPRLQTRVFQKDSVQPVQLILCVVEVRLLDLAKLGTNLKHPFKLVIPQVKVLVKSSCC